MGFKDGPLLGRRVVGAVNREEAGSAREGECTRTSLDVQALRPIADHFPRKTSHEVSVRSDGPRHRCSFYLHAPLRWSSLTDQPKSRRCPRTDNRVPAARKSER